MIPQSPRRLLLLLPAVLSSVHLEVSGELNRTQSPDCNTEMAVHCLRYSETFQQLSVEQQPSECENASLSVQCLEDMLERCPHMDQLLYTTIVNHLDTFRAEEICVNSEPAVLTPSIVLMTMTLLWTSLGYTRTLL